MLPLARFLVGVGPREPEHVGEKPLGKAMAAHNLFGEGGASHGELDGPARQVDEAIDFKAPDHFRHRRPGQLEPFGDAGLNDFQVVFGEFKDALAILFSCRVPFSHAGHPTTFRRRHSRPNRSTPVAQPGVRLLFHR